MKTNIAIIGNGCAATQAVESIRQFDKQSAVTIFTDSSVLPYNPMLLSYFLEGKVLREQFFLKGQDFYKTNRVLLAVQNAVKELHASEKYLLLDNGERWDFDKALLASGAVPVIPEFPGADAENLFTLRTLDAVRQLKVYLAETEVKHALVIGASMIGIKAAEFFQEAGIDCCLADGADRLFPLAACADCAAMMQSVVEEKGIRLRLSAYLDGMEKDRKNRAVRVRFKDGKPPEDVDVVVLCIGVRPNIPYVDREELACDRGILVDGQMCTSVRDIYAAGDCTQGDDRLHGDRRIIGLLNNARCQAQAAAWNMVGKCCTYGGALPHNITRFLDMVFTGIGDPGTGGNVFQAEHRDTKQFIRIVYQGERAVFVNLLNYPELSGILKNCVLRGCNHQLKKENVITMGADEYAQILLRQALRM